jgi:phenylacetic acid degradation operon negative regulatory protein
MLPAELLRADWPGARLRAVYHDFATELAERRDLVEKQNGTQLVEAT